MRSDKPCIQPWGSVRKTLRMVRWWKLSAQTTERSNPGWKGRRNGFEKGFSRSKGESILKYDRDNLWNAKNKGYLKIWTEYKSKYFRVWKIYVCNRVVLFVITGLLKSEITLHCTAHRLLIWLTFLSLLDGNNLSSSRIIIQS